jgi:hypothetical protein
MVLSFLAFSAFAHADSIPGDPVIQVDDPTCGGVEQPPCPIVSALTPFPFFANSSGGGATSFETDPTQPGIRTFDVETLGTFTSTSAVQCFSNVFTCNVTFIGNNTVTDIFFSRCSDCSALTPGAIITIDLGNLASTDCDPSLGHCQTTTGGGWQANQAFVGETGLTTAPLAPLISSPEPSSIFLLAAGSAALFGRRKFLKR